MWPFRKKHTLSESGLLRGFTDWHCHILPGVDDGIRTMEDALAVLAEYDRLGVSEVWLTPHIMEDIPNTTEGLRKRFTELQAEYKGAVRLHLAAENMLDSLFEARLEAGDLLPLGEAGDRLLVETSYFNPPMGFYDILEKIKSKGYYPVLAHPERYVYMDEKDYRRLKQMGIEFQLNLPSLAGRYGTTARKKAEWMQKEEMYNYRGTDLHRIEVLKSLEEIT